MPRHRIWACGDPFHNNFGPFDYRTATKAQRDIVETYHFTRLSRHCDTVESTYKIGGTSPTRFGPFRTILGRYWRWETLHGGERTTDRTARDIPSTAGSSGQFSFGLMTVRSGLCTGFPSLAMTKPKDALEQLQKADELIPNDANVHYNLGLVYFDLKDYGNSLKHAKIAYGLGFPLGGLRSMLESVHEWR